MSDGVSGNGGNSGNIGGRFGRDGMRFGWDLMAKGWSGIWFMTNMPDYLLESLVDLIQVVLGLNMYLFFLFFYFYH